MTLRVSAEVSVLVTGKVGYYDDGSERSKCHAGNGILGQKKNFPVHEPHAFSCSSGV
jgi:hypothetical protein